MLSATIVWRIRSRSMELVPEPNRIKQRLLSHSIGTSTNSDTETAWQVIADVYTHPRQPTVSRGGSGGDRHDSVPSLLLPHGVYE